MLLTKTWCSQIHKQILKKERNLRGSKITSPLKTQVWVLGSES